MIKDDFIKVILKVFVYGTVLLGVIVSVNYAVDASSVIKPQYTEMARLALVGNIVATPENYNERVYQVCIVNELDKIPETVVIGCSRGMFLGEEITGYDNLYNNCVSGACIEDYYALLGLYYKKYGVMPRRVIIETSPWIFYADNPEGRWREDGYYHDAACDFYMIVNGIELAEKSNVDEENPYISLSYFRYNIEQWREQGNKVFEEDARVSIDTSEAADYPDGSIRYEASLENESDERLKKVMETSGACTYQNSNSMKEIDAEKSLRYENLMDYLQRNGTDVIIYMQPFSVTQCKYSIDDNLNPGYMLVQYYLYDLAKGRGIKVHGSFDARDWNLTDNRFIDYMHLDKIGTSIVWTYK